MKTKIIKIVSWIILICSLLGFIYLTYLCFMNPDMTRMRFFLNYWKQELLYIVGMSISMTTIDYISRKELNEAFKSLMNSSRKKR